jgi:3-hydroxyacyl-CoA dehydrogenase
MNYEKIISPEIFKHIDRTFYDLVQQAGEEAAVQADIMGFVLRRKVSEYIDEAVKNIRQSVGGDSNA